MELGKKLRKVLDGHSSRDTGSAKESTGAGQVDDGTVRRSLDGTAQYIPRKPVPSGDSDHAPSRPLIMDRNAPLQHAELGDGLRITDDLVPALSQMQVGEPQSPTSDHRTPKSSLDKPLPYPPSNEFGVGGGSIRQVADDRNATAKNFPGATIGKVPGIEGIDLTNTTDTTIYETVRPAVVHETIRQDVHEIEEQRIEREIHEHHVHHRILPIEDTEVLPARHYIRTDRGLQEVSADQIPGRSSKDHQKIIAESLKKTAPKAEQAPGPRQFSARTFEGTEGDFKENVNADGVHQTERWWVHPPTLQTGGKETGQTVPIHFGYSNPENDGLRYANVAEKPIRPND